MKKRIVVLTMAVLFGLSAVACGSEAPDPQIPEL